MLKSPLTSVLNTDLDSKLYITGISSNIEADLNWLHESLLRLWNVKETSKSYIWNWHRVIRLILSPWSIIFCFQFRMQIAILEIQMEMKSFLAMRQYFDRFLAQCFGICKAGFDISCVFLCRSPIAYHMLRTRIFLGLYLVSSLPFQKLK